MRASWPVALPTSCGFRNVQALSNAKRAFGDELVLLLSPLSLLDCSHRPTPRSRVLHCTVSVLPGALHHPLGLGQVTARRDSTDTIAHQTVSTGRMALQRATSLPPPPLLRDGCSECTECSARLPPQAWRVTRL